MTAKYPKVTDQINCCSVFVVQVRWADIEERQNQLRRREMGFVVGQMDWANLQDDSYASRALNRTKYIWGDHNTEQVVVMEKAGLTEIVWKCHPHCQSSVAAQEKMF